MSIVIIVSRSGERERGIVRQRVSRERERVFLSKLRSLRDRGRERERGGLTRFTLVRIRHGMSER
jgi:hypothetical protein